MTVWKPKRGITYRYSFYLQKQRYFGSTGLTKQADAEEWERREKEKIRRRRAGLEPQAPEDTPRFADWAEIYYEHAAAHVTRPERLEHLIRVVLRYFGARPSGKDPKNPPIDGEPYHDLRLGDPIADADWISGFEAWMDAHRPGGRGRRSADVCTIAGQTKNQYRSVVRQMYQLALQPKWRKRTGIQTNPMDGIYRDRGGGREVTITTDELRRLLEHASYHVRLAVAIGALAPKLRLANILALEWGKHVDAGLQYITVHQHKTAAKTRRPLVIRVSAQLREILEDARRRAPGTHVVSYRGKPIKSLRGGLQAAAKDAGVTYGRFVENGLTFHTLRHTAATMLAELDVAEGKRKALMGHEHIGTTQKYTHLRPVHEEGPLELLSSNLPMSDLVTKPWRRARRLKEAG